MRTCGRRFACCEETLCSCRRRRRPPRLLRVPAAATGGGGDGGGWRSKLPPAPLADVSVRQLLKELSDIVDPPRKLPRFKVHLRRAPTQEVRYG